MQKLRISCKHPDGYEKNQIRRKNPNHHLEHSVHYFVFTCEKGK